ncbi:hypothetical protein PS691_00713 [Pseudomonas fluorescens]|uniref:Uncharacterized protein n=1 Tax=Pseudomonas fluorescens TaxID=294 RepID=A0A5E7AIL5_PSEFL|nr:hypothetical protein PS691_00713 [Pseudomonas fluorescens]
MGWVHTIPLVGAAAGCDLLILHLRRPQKIAAYRQLLRQSRAPAMGWVHTIPLVGAAAGCDLLILHLRRPQKIAAIGSSYADRGHPPVRSMCESTDCARRIHRNLATAGRSALGCSNCNLTDAFGLGGGFRTVSPSSGSKLPRHRPPNVGETTVAAQSPSGHTTRSSRPGP